MSQVWGELLVGVGEMGDHAEPWRLVPRRRNSDPVRPGTVPRSSTDYSRQVPGAEERRSATARRLVLTP